MVELTPVVSVVIPTYNRVADLARALGSVREQTVTNWEVLVVDNCSTDETEAMVQGLSDARIRLLRIQNHGIIAASRNLGIRESRAELIAFLDSDDWWLPAKLERSLAALERGADVVYHDLFHVTGHHQQRHRRRARTFQVRSPVFDDLIERGNALANSSVVVRKQMLEKVGGISEDPELVAVEDYDCWLRIAKCTERFVRLDATLGFYWAGGGNTTSLQRVVGNLDTLRSRYLADRSEPLPPWFHYSMGRTLYCLGRDREAVPHLWTAAGTHASVMTRVKAATTLGALALRRVFRGRSSGGVNAQ